MTIENAKIAGTIKVENSSLTDGDTGLANREIQIVTNAKTVSKKKNRKENCRAKDRIL